MSGSSLRSCSLPYAATGKQDRVCTLTASATVSQRPARISST